MAVFQFYPENAGQESLLTSTARQAGFGGGIVIDDAENRRKRKKYLVLTTGNRTVSMDNPVNCASIKKNPRQTRKEWIVQKKERDKSRGRTVRPNTKYTARKRRIKF